METIVAVVESVSGLSKQAKENVILLEELSNQLSHSSDTLSTVVNHFKS